MLNDRKLMILQAIVRDYIESAEPVGSRSLSKKYDLGISPATIRNEMADLEELGYILQPHTSAGRVPSDKGYRLYVDQLMEIKQTADKNRVKIKTELLRQYNELEQLLQYTSRLLSEFTSYTSIVLAPQVKKSRLKQIKLTRIDDAHLLAIFVTNTGLIQNPVFRVPPNLTGDDLEKIANFLNQKFAGMPLEEIETQLVQTLQTELAQFHSTVHDIMPEMFRALEQMSDISLYLSGTTNIFNFPEFSDLTRAKDFLTLMEEKQVISRMITDPGGGQLKITIGSENQVQRARECSIVSATYQVDDQTLGWLGVIGPTRMDYGHVIDVLDQMSRLMSQALKDKS
ncbi:heat-inducible transcriptional repressor HrcA [Anoxynatronum sibiricum]|uniref:Heat-inducible transcription repressor HrcA n=1 Tax=Anoxynatronum sibiricum TaxID=210623 RepID=A0ABU9VRF8_9CLOT